MITRSQFALDDSNMVVRKVAEVIVRVDANSKVHWFVNHDGTWDDWS